MTEYTAEYYLQVILEQLENPKTVMINSNGVGAYEVDNLINAGYVVLAVQPSVIRTTIAVHHE